MKDPEYNLVLRIKKGDREAFDILYEEHFAALYNRAFLIVRDESVAEEIVAEVFYRLWLKRNTTCITVSVRKYLTKSVYNLSMNYLKHRGIEQRYKDYNIVMHKEKEIVSGNNSTSPLAILEYNELESHVNEAIDNLPEQCRKVFTMNRFNEMKYHEIAKSLDISLSTVKYHMSTALNMIKNKMDVYLNL